MAPLPSSASPTRDAFLAACPSRAIFDRLSEKWALLVLVALWDEAARVGHLRRRLQGASQKVLVQTLRDLERDGLIRAASPVESGPRAEYALTGRGRSLVPLASALKAWAEGNVEGIATSNVAFDDRSEAPPLSGPSPPLFLGGHREDDFC